MTVGRCISSDEWFYDAAVVVLQDGKMHSHAIGSRRVREMRSTLHSEHEDEDKVKIGV